MNRLADIAEQLVKGKELSDFDFEKELAIMGLQQAARDLEFVKTQSANSTINGITRLLVAHPEFVGPVENFVSALATEALKAKEESDGDGS